MKLDDAEKASSKDFISPNSSLCVKYLSQKIRKKVSVPPHFEYFLVDVTPFFVKKYAATAYFL